jgi:hypothetical protein
MLAAKRGKEAIKRRYEAKTDWSCKKLLCAPRAFIKFFNITIMHVH